MENDSKESNVDNSGLQPSLNSYFQQLNSLKLQLAEIESALSEIADDREIYKIIGTIMVSSDYESVKNNLESQREYISERINLLEAEKNKIKDRLNNKWTKFYNGGWF